MPDSDQQEILHRIERKVDRLDERLAWVIGDVSELKTTKNKSLFALIAALTSIIGTGALAILSLI